jgi:tetratricopeptide (TPR) repeat protein
MIFKKPLFILLLLTTLINSNFAFAQQQLSSDELFQQARKAAFERKDYALATELSKKALLVSPDYSDIRIFLGRVYTWWNKTDSARECFKKVLNLQPENEDASSAYADLEYWNNNAQEALLICENGLSFHPQSKVLLLKKAKCLIELKRYKQANDDLAA